MSICSVADSQEVAMTEVSEMEGSQAALERLKAIIEHSDDAIIAKKLDGTITDWNPAAERLFGYLAEETIGKNIAMLAPDNHPDEIPAILERLQRGKRVDHFHTLRKRKDGTLVHVSLTISPIRNAAGKIIGASKIVRDISDIEETRRLRALVENNNLLPKELRHRVGNNLAIVLALLRREVQDAPPEAQVWVTNAIERVYSLASEHEERMQAQDRLLGRPPWEPKS